MICDRVLNAEWEGVVARLGGAAALEAGARHTKAFERSRVVESATDLLRLILAYCLGERGLRSTAAWASAVGLADLSNVALLYRLRRCGDWLTFLVAQALEAGAPPVAHGRLIRLIDGTAVPQAGAGAHRGNRLWRIHSAFDLPAERFSCFELSDERGCERLDQVPVVAGEIRIADRAYLQPDRMAAVLAAGADIVVRAGWKSARWCDATGARVDVPAVLRAAAPEGLIDRPISLLRKDGPALPLRLVAVRKSASACEGARRKARRAAQQGGHHISHATLTAADWVMVVTSLDRATVPAADVLALYRLRWRIELGFKRLKSLIGLKGPPGSDERSAKPYVLAHLLAILLLEPLIDEFEDSPPRAAAA